MDHLTVWNSDSSDTDSILELQSTLSRVLGLPEAIVLQYQAHRKSHDQTEVKPSRGERTEPIEARTVKSDKSAASNPEEKHWRGSSSWRGSQRESSKDKPNSNRGSRAWRPNFEAGAEKQADNRFRSFGASRRHGQAAGRFKDKERSNVAPASTETQSKPVPRFSSRRSGADDDMIGRMRTSAEFDVRSLNSQPRRSDGSRQDTTEEAAPPPARRPQRGISGGVGPQLSLRRRAPDDASPRGEAEGWQTVGRPKQ